jgi:predicted short-subunit dehydrogenase-like oxidoreductase (DUF2520 family)
VTSGPLSGLAIALVGPGRVGTSVARWCLASGATVRSVTRQGRRALPRWGQIAGARSVALGDLEATDCDLLLLAVPDSALAGVAATLAVRPQAGVVLHTSGRLDAEVLAPLRRGGCAVGGLHPLRAFARPLPALTVARRTFLALQGDPAARELGARIAAGLGAPHAEVPAAMRPLYHLAATLAAAGTVTNLAAAIDVAAAVGVPPAAHEGLCELARGAVAAVSSASPIGALTGPVARGELTYIEQLDALREARRELHPVAVLLALEALRELAAEHPLTPSQVALRAALRDTCEQPGFLDPLLTWV